MFIFWGNYLLISCCGNFYNTLGKSFEQISCYSTASQNRITPFFKNLKTTDEIIYVAVCNNCGHLIVKYIKRAKNKNGFESEILNFRGKEADKFFYSHYKQFIEKEIQSPFFKTKNSKTIPYVYGKIIDSYTQVPRYIDESSNAGNLITVHTKISN